MRLRDVWNVLKTNPLRRAPEHEGTQTHTCQGYPQLALQTVNTSNSLPCIFRS